MIDKIYMKYPFYGSRRLLYELNKNGFTVNRKRVQRLMRLMNIEAIYPKPNISKLSLENKIYPYLLRNLEIYYPNQVWGIDITYIALNNGFIYLTALIDLFSRYIVSWSLSNSLDNTFCIETLQNALLIGKPTIHNSDQGSQFTSNNYIEILKKNNIEISMDGKRRAIDNIFIERFWRTIKYENVFINNYESVLEAYEGLKNYINFYNYKRPHQSLNYKRPFEIYLYEKKRMEIKQKRLKIL